MGIVASQLVAEISSIGTDTLLAQMTALSAASDSAAASLARVEVAAGSAAASESADAAATDSVAAASASLSMLALGAGLALAAIGAGLGAAAKAAGDFEAGITTLATGAGELESNLGMVSAGILSLATDTGTSTKDLIAGMYMIESAGFHGAAGLDILKAAAEGAQVGEASLASVANGVTTMMVDYASSGLTAAQATNELIAAVSEGKTHMQDLAQALATILPTSAAAGVGLRDVMAAMATMTGEGTPAAQAATYLRQTILALEAPSKAASKTLADVGLTTQQVATAMKDSLPGALDLITTAIAKKFPPGSAAYIAALKSIVGGTKQLQGILELTGGHMKTFINNVGGIAGAVQKGGKGITGWALVQSSFNVQMAKAREVVEVLAIKIGSALLPVISKIAGAVTPVLTSFSKWISQGDNMKTALAVMTGAIAALATVVLAVAVPAIISLVVAAGPLLLVAAGVGIAIAGVILAVQHWGAISGWLKGAWSSVVAWFNTALKNVEGFFTGTWHKVQSITSAVWGAILAAISKFLAMLVGIFTGQFTAIAQLFVWLYNHNYYFKALIDAIVNVVKGGLTWLHNAWDTIVQFIVAQWNKLKAGAQVVWSAIVLLITSYMKSVQQKIADAWTAVVAIFAGLWNRVIAPLARFVSGLVSWAAGLATQAITWGKNLIQSFINGILSMLGAVLTAAANIAKQVAKALGFHSPTEYGPGKDADKWAPNLIRMFIAGLRAGMPQVQAALDALVNPVGRSPGFSFSASGYRYPAMAGGASSGPVQPIIVNAVLSVDGRLMADAIMPHAASQYITQLGIRSIM